jgi:hypothetical protein
MISPGAKNLRKGLMPGAAGRAGEVLEAGGFMVAWDMAGLHVEPNIERSAPPA